MEPIAPIRRTQLVRREPGPAKRRDEPASAVSVTINVGAAPPEPLLSPSVPPTNLDAHLIAQGARTRGLRSGQNVLDTARHVYLETEWSGHSDRRLKAGRITKTEI